MAPTLFFLIVTIFLTSGCANNKVPAADMFAPIKFVAKTLPEYKGMTHGEIYVINDKKEALEFIKNTPGMAESNDTLLGHLFFGGDPVTPGTARVVAAACGGDKYIAANLAGTKGRINFMWVQASPELTRELITQGFLKLPKPGDVKTSDHRELHKPTRTLDLLLNNSTL